MFTGIIKNTGKVLKILKKNKGFELEIYSNLTYSKKDIGTSIAVNGVCLTLVKCVKKSLFFLSLIRHSKSLILNILKKIALLILRDH